MLFRSSTDEETSLKFIICGSPPIDAPLKILQFFPMTVLASINTCEPMTVPLPIFTFEPIMEKGPTVTSFASSESGSMIELV